VIPVQFDYLAPATIEEALAALSQHGDEAKIMAGGQSLLPVLRMRLNAPEMVIDLGKIESLRGIRDDGDAIVIGAMTPHVEVGSDNLVAEHAALISKAIEHLADAQIRHRGTFGGALAHADPAGDLGAPTLALGAQFVIAGSGGTRTVEADDFFVDLFETAIGEDEILTEVRIPKHTGWGAHYEKFVRVAHQWPIVAVAAAVLVDGGTITQARVGLTNMGSTPLRARSVEDALAGQPATADGVRAAAEKAAEGTNPPSDLNGDADYRRHLAGVLTRRAVLAATGTFPGPGKTGTFPGPGAAEA
jgi:aerobic carbon-monoxide dehydrogenase medium subunit